MSAIIFNNRVFATRRAVRLLRPLPTLPHHGTLRELAIVSVKDSRGVDYYGEIAPLPGFSVETLDDALSELDSVAYSIPPLEAASLTPPPTWSVFLRGLHCPSLRCALEGVLIDYMARCPSTNNVPWKRAVVECNGLLAAESKEATSKGLRSLLERGFTSVKVKLSPSTIENTLRALSDTPIPSGTRFRFDANRSFARGEWSEVSARLTSLPVEYVEEPVTSTDDLASLTRNSHLPIALDETTRELPPEEWLTWGVKAVVLKPTINGGLLSLSPLINRIEASGAYVTLSSSFESGVGLRAIALYAASLSRCGAVGLDTAAYLSEDLLSPAFPVATPHLAVADLLPARFTGGVG